MGAGKAWNDTIRNKKLVRLKEKRSSLQQISREKGETSNQGRLPLHENGEKPNGGKKIHNRSITPEGKSLRVRSCPTRPFERPLSSRTAGRALSRTGASAWTEKKSVGPKLKKGE